MEENEHLHFGVQWLGYSNSMLNPILYAALNLEFRNELKNILESIKKNIIYIFQED